MDIIPHKCCIKCGADKPLTEFYKCSGGKDGHRTDCKVCNRLKTKRWCEQNIDRVREYTRTHKEAAAAHARKYDATHRKERRMQGRIRYAKNPEKARAYARRQRIENREATLFRQRRWYYANPDHSRSVFRNARKRHHGSIVALNHKRRALLKGVEGSFSDIEWQVLCKQYDHRCLACGQKRKLTRDHIIPITKGGTNYISNIQPLCGPCNSSKGDKTIDYRPSSDRPQYYQERLL